MCVYVLSVYQVPFPLATPMKEAIVKFKFPLYFISFKKLGDNDRDMLWSFTKLHFCVFTIIRYFSTISVCNLSLFSHRMPIV